MKADILARVRLCHLKTAKWTFVYLEKTSKSGATMEIVHGQYSYVCGSREVSGE